MSATFSAQTNARAARVMAQPKMWPPVPPAMMGIERLIATTLVLCDGFGYDRPDGT